MNPTDEVAVTVPHNDSRDAITTKHTEVPTNWYRVSQPPIFCGFQTNWIDGEYSEVPGVTFNLTSGAGCGSRYMVLRVHIPGVGEVYEYVDVTEALTARVDDILTEHGVQRVAPGPAQLEDGPLGTRGRQP